MLLIYEVPDAKNSGGVLPGLDLRDSVLECASPLALFVVPKAKHT